MVKIAKTTDKKQSVAEKVSKPKSLLKNRFNKLRVKTADIKSKGIIYIGHLPKGFGEKELKGFFHQFGKITKLRVARSKKTGRSKGYAYVEFQQKDVAKEAEKAMSGYMMFKKQIECHIVDQPHKDLFLHANRDWKYVPNVEIKKTKMNNEKTPEQMALRVKGILEKEKEKRLRFRELEIDYEFSGYQGIIDQQKKPKAAKKTVIVEKKEEKSVKKVAKKSKK